MKSIDLRSRPDLFHGVREVRSVDGGALPVRLTPELIAYYEVLDEMKGRRARSSAGVRLMVRSTTRNVRFRVKIRSWNCDFYAFDLADEAGNMQSIRVDQGENESHFSFCLPEGNREFVLYFPYEVEPLIYDFSIDDEAECAPVILNRRTMVFIGDSISQGMEAVAPSTTFPALLGARFHCEYFNLGVGGMIMCANTTAEALRYSWDYAFLAYGVNDVPWKTNPVVFAAETRTCLHLLCSRTRARVHLMTPIYWPDGEEIGQLRSYREILCSIAAEFPEVVLIDGETLVPPDRKYFYDGVHPNASGMRLMAENLAAGFREAEKTHNQHFIM